MEWDWFLYITGEADEGLNDGEELAVDMNISLLKGLNVLVVMGDGVGAMWIAEVVDPVVRECFQNSFLLSRKSRVSFTREAISVVDFEGSRAIDFCITV